MKSIPTILHISTYYSRSALYRTLFKKIKTLGYRQIVFTPIRTSQDRDSNIIVDRDWFKFHYALVLKLYHKFLYFLKVKTVYKEMIKSIDISDVSICHAHTVFSDGGVALKLKRVYNIPYIVAVRNTDINTFFKKLFFLRSYGRQIIRNAEKVIVLNYSYKSYLLSYFCEKERSAINAKIQVIPNGISDFWFETIATPKVSPDNCSEFLYVGTFLRNKNVDLVINSLYKYATQNPNDFIKLHLVGGGGRAGRGRGDLNIQKYKNAKNTPQNFNIIEYGRVDDKRVLKELYRNAHAFIMISRKESFGLVYVESMSQGTPIIYTNGQGISSFFKNGEVGWGIDEFSSMDVIDGIRSISKYYNEMSKICIEKSKEFNWDDIAGQYHNIYQKTFQNEL